MVIWQLDAKDILSLPTNLSSAGVEKLGRGVLGQNFPGPLNNDATRGEIRWKIELKNHIWSIIG